MLQVVATPQALLIVFSLLCILTGLDLWISQKRWKQGAKDLNPVVQHFASKSTLLGLLALASINLLVIAAAFLYLPLILILLGGKLALASLQLRSLINEHSDAD